VQSISLYYKIELEAPQKRSNNLLTMFWGAWNAKNKWNDKIYSDSSKRLNIIYNKWSTFPKLLRNLGSNQKRLLVEFIKDLIPSQMRHAIIYQALGLY